MAAFAMLAPDRITDGKTYRRRQRGSGRRRRIKNKSKIRFGTLSKKHRAPTVHPLIQNRIRIQNRSDIPAKFFLVVARKR
jgi:hypothetical protein